MPSFDGRRRELRSALAGLKPAPEPAELVRMSAVVEEYLNARDAILTMMQVLLAEDGAEPLVDEYAGKLRDMTRAATDRLDDMLSGLSGVSDAALRWHEQVSFAEFIFWGQLGALRLAQARDALARDTARVREQISVLDKKWQNLSEEDLRVEEAEQRAAQELKDLLEQALATAMPYWLQVGAAVVELREAWKGFFASITDHVKEALVGAGAPRELVEALLTLAAWANNTADIYEMCQRLGAKVDDAMDWLNRIRSMNVGGLVQYRLGTALDSKTKNILALLDFACKGLKPLMENRYEARMTAWKAQLDNEGILIVSYGGIRQQVDQFLKDCNLDGQRATCAAVLSAMDGLDSVLPTDGQKSDWSELRRGLRDGFLSQRQAAETAFNDFFRANDGRFLGGLSTETERALLEPDKWLVTINGVIAVGLDARLREWRQNVTVVQGGPKEAFDSVQDAFAGLPLDVRDKVKGCLNEYLSTQMTQLNAEADKAIALLDSCALMVNAKKISDDMDRSRLSQALRATVR